MSGFGYRALPAGVSRIMNAAVEQRKTAARLGADARRYAGNLTDEQRREVLADLAAAAAAIREASEVIAAAGTPGPAPSR